MAIFILWWIRVSNTKIALYSEFPEADIFFGSWKNGEVFDILNGCILCEMFYIHKHKLF